jgi:hypothetical protein
LGIDEKLSEEFMREIYVDPKFGNYRVWLGNTLKLETSFKVEAIETVKRSGGHITWHFNDEIFGSYDWTKEIQESIGELYRRRAQSLRQKYKKIIVMYSGGYDSHNILMSFLENDIPVDAICSFYNSLNREPDDHINIEWSVQTWPRIQRIREKYPKVDFFRIDTSQNSLDMIDIHADDWKYLGRGAMNPSTLGLSYLHTLLPQQYQGDDTVMLFGIEKPRLRYKNGEFIYNFYDICFRPPFYRESQIEYFYWSPDCPELIIKQAQIVKKYWSSNMDLMKSMFSNRRDAKLGIVLDHSFVPTQKLYYPSCSDGVFLTWRPTDPTLQSRDWWIYRGNTDYSFKMNDLISSSIQSIGCEWFNQKDLTKGLIGFLSRDYLV